MNLFEQRNGAGEVCVTYDLDAQPAFLRERIPSWEALRQEALRELEWEDRQRGVDIPLRNPGLEEDEGLPWLVVLALVAVFVVGALLAAFLP